MDAYLSTSQNRSNYLDSPPVLIAADSENALARARQTAALSGLRVAEVGDLDGAPDRIRRQAAASALWIELDGGGGNAAQAVLDEIAADVSSGRYSAVLAAPSALLDDLGRHAFESGIDILIDAGDAERAAALALAVSGTLLDARVSDVTADKNAVRLRQLSEEVSRIASTLARLSAGPASAIAPIIESAPSADLPQLPPDAVRGVIRARRSRARYFAEDLFADPAWDMMLDLLQAEISQLRVPVSSLCIAAAVPATTALRWLKTLVQQGLFVRRADPHDGRRVFVELAPETSQALRRYFADVGQVAVI
jgi:hypothetical protein